MSEANETGVNLPSGQFAVFRETALREAALSHACRHRTAGETGKDVVRNAEVYLAFLRGEPEERESAGVDLTDLRATLELTDRGR